MTAATRLTVLMGVGLAMASALVVRLGWREMTLNKAYAELRAKATLPYRGYAVPTFRAATLAGDSLTIGELPDSGARQVVLVLTTSCPFCKATLPVWAALADSLTRLGAHRVLALSLDSATTTRRYVAEHHLGYPVLTFPHWKTAQLFRARAVPQTLVLNQFGEVVFAHTGRLDPGPVLDSVYAAARGAFDAWDPRPAPASTVAAATPAAPPPGRP